MNTDKSRLTAILLSMFFGPIGLQHFYLGATLTGVAVLSSSAITGLVLGFADSFLSVISLLFMSSYEFKLRYSGRAIDKPLWRDLKIVDVLRKEENYVSAKNMAAEGDFRGALARLLLLKESDVSECVEYWAELVTMATRVLGPEKALPLAIDARAKGLFPFHVKDREARKVLEECVSSERRYRKNLDDKATDEILQKEFIELGELPARRESV